MVAASAKATARDHAREGDRDSEGDRGRSSGNGRSSAGERARGPLHPVLIAGWLAKGVVYCTIGVIALQVAFGDRGEEADEEGAMRAIADQPLGGTLLWMVAGGLALYVIGRVLEAVLVASDRPWSHRLAIAGSGLVHGTIALAAAQFAMGDGSGNNDQEETWTARVLELPAGQWLLALGALVLLAIGVALIWGGVSRRFVDELDLDRASDRARRILVPVGILGVAARGAAVALLAWFLARAALEQDPQEAAGLDEALRELADTPVGQVVLAVLAVGFIAFGALCIAHAKLRRA